MKRLIIILIALVASTLVSCGPSKVICYNFTPDYVSNTVETKIITNRDTLYFGKLSQTELMSFIDYYMISTYKAEK